MIRPVLLLIAVVAIAVPASLVATVRPGPVQLQRMANASCKCARSFPHATSICWARFNWLARKTYNVPALVAEIPISADPICRRDGPCIVLRYRIIVAPDAPDLCSAREAIRGGTLWERQVRSTGTDEEIDAAFHRANASLARFAAGLAKGE